MKCYLTIYLFFFTLFIGPTAQQLNSAEIFQNIKKLNVLGNVLYLAAHPDDENTRFISYCANEKLLNTGYLSLTRGSGGQNLIGTEIREELGIIRTQELLSARKIDGGKQFFSRANDFGYSKTPDETFKIWNKQKILHDVVWVIRKFRPDVIVCRFPLDGKGGHGHHTASALLAAEAFQISSDPSKYKEQLQYVTTWQPKRVVVNTGRWWNDKISDEDPTVVSQDIGGYNKLLGTSYNELAALSRSMHKSQGFGSTGKRGKYLEFFEYLKGDSAKINLFDGIDFSWGRITTPNISLMINKIVNSYNIKEPSQSIPRLIQLRKMIETVEDQFWKEQKLMEVDQLILQCSGLFIQMTTLSSKKTINDSVTFNLEIVNRCNLKMQLKSINCKVLNYSKKYTKDILENEVYNLKSKVAIPAKTPVSQPYWLVDEPKLGSYNVDSLLLIGKSENNPAAEFEITIKVGDITISYQKPLIYKWNDPVNGEQNKNWIVSPKVTANFDQDVMIFSDQKKKKFTLKLLAHTDNQKGTIKISSPIGWKVIGPKDFLLLKNGDQQFLEYEIFPENNAIPGALKVEINNQDAFAINTIDYDHIAHQTWFPKAKLELAYFKLNIPSKKIGYFMGAGDLVPEYLKILNYQVEQIDPEKTTLNSLQNYDVIITGIRFFNVNPMAEIVSPLLLEYVNEGGNLIVQYNTSYRLKTKEFFPYPLQISRDRVTQEDAEVTFLNRDHPVMNQPNKIQKEDFDFWVQERGLYFPNLWSKKYTPILSFHDDNEEAKKGSLLISQYGKGYYTYTGISFFRQLPAGVSGAYKLLVNLISLSNE